MSVSNNFLYEPLHVIEFPVCALVLTVVGFELEIKKLLNIIVAALEKHEDRVKNLPRG